MIYNKKCAKCGKSFNAKHSGFKYCCEECKKSVENQRDIQNHRIRAFGSIETWQKVQERDHFRCVLCGLSEEESKKTYNQSLSIHHINFDENNHDLSNLETLCRKCHNGITSNHHRKKFPTDGEVVIFCETAIRVAHFLRDGYPHKCKNLHGEYLKFKVWIIGKALNEYGMVVDFGEIKKIIDEFDHKCLNDLPPFDKINPTVENVAKCFYYKIQSRLDEMINKPLIKKIRVYESNTSYAEFDG